MASDADLNTYMGLRKYAPYRKEGKGRNWDAQRTTRLKDLKQKLGIAANPLDGTQGRVCATAVL